MKRDTLYNTPQTDLVDFAFNAQVADVFPDMIRRSVPGYETIISYMGLFAEQYVKPKTYCYDLGCSRGASSLSLRSRMHPDAILIAVDNSNAMIEKCEALFPDDDSKAKVSLRCEDILQTEITKASLVVMNFTLQFIKSEKRQALIERIFAGMNSSGALVIAEKIAYEDAAQEKYLQSLHTAFKRANGYSELEISQKRSAIENVLVRDTLATHEARLLAAGFSQVVVWQQCLNFCAMVAIK